MSGNGQQDGAAYFGQEVRFAREQQGLTQAQVAEQTGYERPYVTRVEGGKLLASAQFADACDSVFGTPGFFARLRERVTERGHPGWFIPYVDLEREATEILNYSPSVVAGVLQTREYATAVFRQAHPRESADEIAARVEMRLARQTVLDRPDPPLTWIVFHEAALRTVMGDRHVMANQLAHLLKQAESPHVTLQVLPFAEGLPAGPSLFILVSPEEGPALLYTETMMLGHVDDSAGAVAEAQRMYDRLRAAAMSPDDSLGFIRGLMKEYSNEHHP
ncbi:helix-turn-helix domain-containing protein [Actinacidiphila alni]|uniref:helix-turn-helix domain-containing protein n=1 Tax=Actinacidiphila alni TaxID=380248 RepID=UPI00345445FD